VAIKFKREDAKTCFRCQVNPPQFRLISLEKVPTEGGTLEPDCLVELLCPSCMRLEIDDFYEALAQSNIPVGADETPDVRVRRQIGFAVVPFTFSERESQFLIDELRTNGFEKGGVGD
jgi:hypothetical protein